MSRVAPPERVLGFLPRPDTVASDRLLAARRAFLDVAPVVVNLPRQDMAVVAPASLAPIQPLVAVSDGLVGLTLDHDRIVGAR